MVSSEEVRVATKKTEKFRGTLPQSLEMLLQRFPTFLHSPLVQQGILCHK